jgi:hypothetical protein
MWNMAKCLFPGCKTPAVGGFKHEVKDVPNDWSYTTWCADHEESLRESMKGGGRDLTSKELEAL